MRMQSKFEMVPQERFNLGKDNFEPHSVRREHHKIICVADIVFRAEGMFHKLVELVHVDIYEELGGKIPEGETNSF